MPKLPVKKIQLLKSVGINKLSEWATLLSLGEHVPLWWMVTGEYTLGFCIWSAHLNKTCIRNWVPKTYPRHHSEASEEPNPSIFMGDGWLRQAALDDYPSKKLEGHIPETWRSHTRSPTPSDSHQQLSFRAGQLDSFLGCSIIGWDIHTPSNHQLHEKLMIVNLEK